MTPPVARRLADVPLRELARTLAMSGLWLNLGAATIHLTSQARALPAQLAAVYPHFPFIDRAPWADIHAQMRPVSGLRRLIRPQVVLFSDGRRPFEAFPADTALPLFEWGCNWLIGQRLNHLLLLHAGALERDGLALLLPAVPGSGKSTLTAALALRGWRLMSDEFGAWDTQAGIFRSLLKPVALKNQSIAVIRAFDSQAVLGPLFPKTRKGDVAHMAAPADAVARRAQPARPGAVILPRWQAGSPTQLEPLLNGFVFPSLAFNAFNYELLGAAGFKAAIALTRRCLAWQLVYSDLDDAIATIDRLWPQVVEHAQTTPAAAAS